MAKLQLPEQLWWDHNAHYHRWLLTQLPERTDRVLDVGCGAGRLACALSERSRHVDALDPSWEMIQQARRRQPDASNISWLHGNFLDPETPLQPGGYDAITAVASLHHMPLLPALARFAVLLRPGGVLAMVGLYKPSTVSDVAMELMSIPANVVVGMGLSLRGRAGKPDDDGMPWHAPSASLGEIRKAVEQQLPGAHLRRAVFWRYLLTWRRD